MPLRDGDQLTQEQRRAELLRIHSELLDMEIRWRDRQLFLQARGYMLRPRYRPGWVPSWQKDSSLRPEACEDYIMPYPRPQLTDATRIADNSLVYIKRVYSQSEELKIAAMLGSEELTRDKRNHCVPVIEHFQDDEDADISYIVMPFLRPIDEPPFETVDNVIDFVDQILEGLVFLHGQGVAHRDCAPKNLLMDANSLYPEGFHPIYMDALPDASGEAPMLPRKYVPVKYFFVDFGISVHIPADAADKLVVGDDGRDQEVPELSITIPYDPFKVDVFIIGNLLRYEFEQKFSNVSFLRELITYMTAADPKTRPDATQALDKWKKIRRKLFFVQRVWRVRERTETWSEAMALDFASARQLPAWFARRAASIRLRKLLNGLRGSSEK